MIKFIHQEFSGLHQAAFLLGLSSLLSQLLALMRDRLLVSSFGTGINLDIYYAAFRIPDIIFASIASFVSVTVLIPFLIERLEEGEELKAKRFMSIVFSAFCVVMVVVSAVLFFFVPSLSKLVAPGFDPAARIQLIMLTRILLLSPFLLGLSNLLGSVTQAYKKFFVYALSPILYNVGIIIGIVFFFPYWGLSGLAYGVILGALMHLLIQIPAIYKTGLLPRFTSAWNWQELRQVIMISLPRTLALATDKISILILVALASLMATGAISIFNLSFNLQSVPLAIVAVSYSVAVFPTLAQIFKRKEIDVFLDKMGTALRHIIFWSMPAMVFFIVLRAQIVRVVLGARQFSWSDTRITAAALALFIISIVAQGFVLIFVRAYYAGGRTMKPLIINGSTSLLTIVFAFVLVKLFDLWPFFRFFWISILRVDDVSVAKVLMLPLAYSLNNLINAWLLWLYFEKDFGRLPGLVRRAGFECFSAAVISGFFVYETLDLVGRVLSLNSFWGVFLQGFLSGLVGIVVLVAILKSMGNRELSEVYTSLHGRIWRQQRIITDENV